METQVISIPACSLQGEQQPGSLAKLRKPVFFSGLSCAFRKIGLLPPLQPPDYLPPLGDQLWELHLPGCR